MWYPGLVGVLVAVVGRDSLLAQRIPQALDLHSWTRTRTIVGHLTDRAGRLRNGGGRGAYVVPVDLDAGAHDEVLVVHGLAVAGHHRVLLRHELLHSRLDPLGASRNEVRLVPAPPRTIYFLKIKSNN